MSKIVKIIFDDGSEIEYKEQPLEAFSKQWNPGWWFRNQHEQFEQDCILPRLQTNLENWAKEQYDLVDEDDVKKIDDFSDWEIEKEFKDRCLNPNLIPNENIINQDFVSRIVKITEYGNDSEIDKALEILEKAYRIK